MRPSGEWSESRPLASGSGRAVTLPMPNTRFSAVCKFTGTIQYGGIVLQFRWREHTDTRTRAQLCGCMYASPGNDASENRLSRPRIGGAPNRQASILLPHPSKALAAMAAVEILESGRRGAGKLSGAAAFRGTCAPGPSDEGPARLMSERTVQ